MKKYLVMKVLADGRKIPMLATNDYQKAKDEFIWSDYCAEIYLFDEQGNHIRTVSGFHNM